MTIYPSFSSRKRPIWIVDYALLGRQRRKPFPRNPSVARSDDPGHKLAEKFAAAQTKKIFNEGPSLASLENHERIALLGFSEKMKSLGVTLAQAEAMVISALQKPPALAPLVSVVVEECLNSKRARLGVGMSSRYLKQLSSVLNQFSFIFKNTPIDQIKASDIEVWIQGGDYSSASRRSRLGDIRTLFSFAIRRKYLKENPFSEIEGIKVARKTPGILSPRQASKLLRVAHNRDRRLCPWLALQLFCGIRAEEMDRLTAKNVILEKKIVHIPAESSKTGTARNVTIPENALEWLRIDGDWPEVRGYQKKAPKLMGIKNLKERFDRLRRQAGLFKKWPNRAMRHSSVTYLYALTGDANAVAKNHGHGVSVMLVNYNAAKLPSGEVVTKEMAQEYFEIRPPCIVRVLESVA